MRRSVSGAPVTNTTNVLKLFMNTGRNIVMEEKEARMERHDVSLIISREVTQ